MVPRPIIMLTLVFHFGVFYITSMLLFVTLLLLLQVMVHVL